ncbi:MAG: ParA family protein [Candidatus Liptonbacteria bacterium]|nr:ParA family protein [Candidatus Liptonbacteria bacterium]
MARVIAICNAKGGVGKTTSAVNLGGYLASHGRSTLVIDFDPQGNASSALGHNVMGEEHTIYHGIFGISEPHALIKNSALYGLSYVPAGPHLAGALIELVEMPEREHCLRKFITGIRHNYDYILIDLPPSLSLLTVNGLIAADEVLIPVQAEYYSLEGLGQLLHTINLVRDNLRHPLMVAGAVLTMYDKRERLSREVGRELRRHFPHHVYNTEIPKSIALAEAPSFAKPVILHAPNSVGAYAYNKLAKEIIRQEDQFQMSPQFGNFNL